MDRKNEEESTGPVQLTLGLVIEPMADDEDSNG